MKEDRTKQALQLKLAIQKALQLCEAKGLLKPLLPDNVEEPKDAEKPLQGGGTENQITLHVMTL